MVAIIGRFFVLWGVVCCGCGISYAETEYVILSGMKWSRRIYAPIRPLKAIIVRRSFDSLRSLRMTNLVVWCVDFGDCHTSLRTGSQ